MEEIEVTTEAELDALLARGLDRTVISRAEVSLNHRSFNGKPFDTLVILDETLRGGLIDRWNGDGVRSLGIFFIPLSPRDVTRLTETFSGLDALILHKTDVDDSGAQAIAQNLTALTSLNLGFSSIGDSGAQAIAKNLTALTSLNLGNNSIGDNGALAIARNLTALTSLNLGNNSIDDNGAQALLEAFLDRPIRTLNLRGNKCTETLLTPEDWRTADASAILAAWRVHQEGPLEPLNEAKLLVVGDEAVGKTSLVRYLIHRKARDPREEKTAGIVLNHGIGTEKWLPEGCDIRLNVWDFGGQEIMHGTHRYFLTRRSVYLLVLEDRREDDPPVDRWMAVIENVAEDSPVLIVINKSDAGKEALRLDEAGLMRRYPQIVGVVRTACNDDEWSAASIDGLCATIAGVLTDAKRLPHVRNPVPAGWLTVKQAVTERAKSEAVLDIAAFKQLCVDPAVVGEHPVKDADEQRALLRQLHELGAIVAHGLRRDALSALKGVTLLDPNWLTGAIYAVLASHDLRNADGEFSRGDLVRWLDDATYPVERHEYIVSMMRHEDIELCFRLPGEAERFLAPEALSPQSLPDPEWENALRFRWRYAYLPPGLIPRLIVRTHQFLTENRRVWRTGMWLEIGRSTLFVEADRAAGVVDVAVKGPDAREALATLRHTVEALHRDLEIDDVRAMVPMPDDPALEEEYAHLVMMLEEDGPDEEHRPTGSKRKYRVGDLLDTVRERCGARDDARMTGEVIIMGDNYTVGQGAAGRGRLPRGIRSIRFGSRMPKKSICRFLPVNSTNCAIRCGEKRRLRSMMW